MPEHSDSHRFIAARAILRRILEDWPYQPPEVIEVERVAFQRFLEDTNPTPAEYMAALREEASLDA